MALALPDDGKIIACELANNGQVLLRNIGRYIKTLPPPHSSSSFHSSSESSSDSLPIRLRFLFRFFFF
jgi:hypothetical protein